MKHGQLAARVVRAAVAAVVGSYPIPAQQDMHQPPGMVRRVD